MTFPVINPTNKLHLIDDQYNQQQPWNSDWSSTQPTTVNQQQRQPVNTTFKVKEYVDYH